MDTLTIFVALR